MAAEGALVDLAVVEAVEGHAVVFELDDCLVGLAAHEFDRILVAEVIGALDRVIHVPVPVVRFLVAERGGHSALRRDGMRARRKHLRQDCHPQVGFRELQRRAQA